MNLADVNSPSYNSHYGVFLDNYNKGNYFLNNATGSFFDQIDADKKKIISSGDNTLKEKFSQFDQLASDKEKSNYEKAAMAGNILADVARDIITSADPQVKKSGINIINSFLNVAKETQNQLLINTAIKISDNISALI